MPLTNAFIDGFASSPRRREAPHIAGSMIRPTEPRPMAKKPSSTPSKDSIEVVEPIGKRVLVRKDEDKKITKVGIHLPDKIEIPTLTGRVVAISAQVDNDDDYPIAQYDRVLFNPKNGIPVDFEGDNRLFVIPIEDIVAVFRRD
jgi:chaperonin GroES